MIRGCAAKSRTMKLPNWMVTPEQWKDRPIQICLESYVEEGQSELSASVAKKTTEAIDYLIRMRDSLILNGIKNEPALEIIDKILSQIQPTDKEKTYLRDFIESYMKKEQELRFQKENG